MGRRRIAKFPAYYIAGRRNVYRQPETANEKPLFRKGGLGGFPPRLIPTKGRIQADALVGGLSPPRAFRTEATFRDAGRGEIPPTPLLRKGGFSGLAPTPAFPPSFRCPPPSFPRKRESTPYPLCVPLRLCASASNPLFRDVRQGEIPPTPLLRKGSFSWRTGVCLAAGWAAHSVSPSPHPLPLGEGYSGRRRLAAFIRIPIRIVPPFVIDNS